jgi:hypothetical protein
VHARPLLLPAISVLALLIAGGAAIEWGARLADQLPISAGQHGRTQPFGRLVPDLETGWRLRPSYRYGAEQFSTNSEGFRDRERPHERPAGIWRVAVLGDENVAGVGVADGQTFTTLMERMLPGTSFWNLGVPGYGTEQAARLWAAERSRVLADVVVLVVSSGDPLDDLLGVDRARITGGEWTRRAHLPRDRSMLGQQRTEVLAWNARVLQGSFALHLLGRLDAWEYYENGGTADLDGLRPFHQGSGSPWMSLDPEPELVARAWELNALFLRHLRDLCNADGAPLVLVAMPTPEGGQSTRLREIARELDIELIDVNPTLEKSSGLFYEDEALLNADGHRAMATALRAELERKGFLPAFETEPEASALNAPAAPSETRFEGGFREDRGREADRVVRRWEL